MALKTPFFDRHVEMGAKMVEFAGYMMPVSYTGINAEHLHVRNALGVFDVSHMGEFFIEGNDAEAFLQKTTINDVAALIDLQAQYSAMCYEDGGIVDDCIVYRFGPRKYMVVVNAANLSKDYEWLEKHLSGDVTLTDRSEEYALLAVQGPHSRACMNKISEQPVDDIKFYHFMPGRIAGEDVLISRTGYTGEMGYEIYHLNHQADRIWQAVFDAGREFDIQPIGLGARDTLRLEMKYCLYGNDIDAVTNPLEAGLGWICKLKKDADFIGKEAILEVKKQGVTRKLMGFRMLERGIPRHGYTVKAGGKSVGVVTSGTQSPSLSEGIGLAYIAVEDAVIGGRIEIDIRGKAAAAELVKTPFVESSPL